MEYIYSGFVDLGRHLYGVAEWGRWIGGSQEKLALFHVRVERVWPKKGFAVMVRRPRVKP